MSQNLTVVKLFYFCFFNFEYIKERIMIYMSESRNTFVDNR